MAVAREWIFFLLHLLCVPNRLGAEGGAEGIAAADAALGESETLELVDGNVEGALEVVDLRLQIRGGRSGKGHQGSGNRLDGGG